MSVEVYDKLYKWTLNLVNYKFLYTPTTINFPIQYIYFSYKKIFSFKLIVCFF